MSSTAGPDLSAVLVSTFPPKTLGTAIESLRRHTGSIELEVVVVANGSFAEARTFVASCPDLRYVECQNRGYGHGNNVGAEFARSRYVLFLNPDIEVVDGTLERLVERLDADPAIGALGVRQLDTNGALSPSIRRSPSVLRTFGDALMAEHWPVHVPRFVERELRADCYLRDRVCDWVLGSFLLVRRQAFEEAGRFDLSFFLYREEPDLSQRLRVYGWTVAYTPAVTVRHAGEGGKFDATSQSQKAFAQLQYAAKHLASHQRVLVRLALIVKYLVRLLYSLHEPRWRSPALAALATVLGMKEPPSSKVSDFRDAPSRLSSGISATGNQSSNTTVRWPG